MSPPDLPNAQEQQPTESQSVIDPISQNVERKEKKKISGQKLDVHWQNVLKEPSQPIKPTIATILREHKLVESQDAAKRQELETLVNGGMSAENYLYWAQKKKEEEERQNEEKINQRKIDARMTAQRTLEIGRQKLEEKRKAVEQIKEEEIKLKRDLDIRNEEDLQAARDRVDQILLCEMKAQFAVLQKERQNKYLAQQVQQTTESLMEKSKRAKAKEEKERKERVQKIQAASLVSHQIRKVYNPYELKERGLGCEMSDTEAQFRIYLQKCEEDYRVQDVKDKARAAKIAKKEKLEAAMKKISEYRELVKESRKYKQKTK